MKSVQEIIKEFAKKLPKFPDGRIDYSHADTAPVLNVVLKWKDKILILKRSDKVKNYKRKWNTLGGYLDDLQSLQEKVREELREELQIVKITDSQIHLGTPYTLKDTEINKTWIVHPVVVLFKKKPKVVLDWEHTEYRWIHPGEINDFDTIQKLDDMLKNLNILKK